MFIETAIAIAVEAHKGQKDKGGEPYILHALRVMHTVQGNEEIKAAAVLHDVLEDTKVTEHDLREAFIPERTIELVKILSHKSRDEVAYFQYLQKLSGDPGAVAIKLADLKDNMDVTRLFTITPKDASRLEKYNTAYKYLREVMQ